MDVYSSRPVRVGRPFVGPDVLAGALKRGNKAAVAHVVRLTVRSGAS